MKAQFFEANVVVEVTEFDSFEAILKVRTNDIGSTLDDVLTNRQKTMLKNGHKVRFGNNEAIKIY